MWAGQNRHGAGRMTATQAAATQLWSIAGTDSSGGAGLAADQRAAAAFGVHLCPVVAAVTTQNSQSVTQIHATPADVLRAQLQALSDDLPSGTQRIVIKTGLLGSTENVRTVAEQVRTLRQQHRVILVIDPVLRASTGAAFASADMVQAYRKHLLPLADLLTPNRAEAARLCGLDASSTHVPTLAQALLKQGAQAVCITGGDALPDSLKYNESVRSLNNSSSNARDISCDWNISCDWMSAPHNSLHVEGWLTLPRIHTPHTHGTGCTFASSAAAAMAQGFMAADALVLAKMATAHAIANHRVLGQGNGSVYADADFHRARYFPALSLNADLPDVESSTHTPDKTDALELLLPKGLYTLASSPEQLLQQIRAGARVVQLRIKTPASSTTESADWQRTIRTAIQQSMQHAEQHGATLFINDHWQHAIACNALGIHLGQEDVLAMTDAQREQLQAWQQRGGLLGISSHSLWELARAQSLNPIYIACGPVWATTTKDMPWQPQGMRNLRYWVQVAGRPVVAIGGVLNAEQVRQCAEAGAHSVCAVRAVAQNPETDIPAFQAAYEQGNDQVKPRGALPQPSLLL